MDGRGRDRTTAQSSPRERLWTSIAQKASIQSGEMSTPVLSVVIPTRNRAALLAGALASVEAIGSDRLQVEKIVVDDGSTDETRLVADRYGVRLLASPDRGASAARNHGMAAATGEFLLFLDVEEQIGPIKVRRRVAFRATA